MNEATILLINMVSLQQWRAAIAGSGCRRIHGDSVILGPRSRPEVDLPHITSPTVKATLEEARTQPFASWLAKLPSGRRHALEEGTASLHVDGIVDPPPEDNNCFFCCLLLILAEAVATRQLTAVALAETFKMLLGDDTMAVGLLMPFVLHASLQPGTHARAITAEVLFRSAGCSAALLSLRQIVHAALVQALQTPKGKVAIDESHIEPADAQLVCTLGAAVPIGVCAAFLNMLPIRLAVITEGCNGLVSRRDAGGDLGAPLLGGLLVCKNHAHYLLASEIAPAMRIKPVDVPPSKTSLTFVVHLHGSATVVKGGDAAEAISSLVSHLPDGQWRVVVDEQSLAVEPALSEPGAVALVGSVLHVLPYVCVGGQV